MPTVSQTKAMKLPPKTFIASPQERRTIAPTPDCLAWLTPVMRNGIRNPYFRALPSHPHREGCPFAKNAASPKERYDERKFDFHCILSNFMSADKGSSSHTNHTAIHPSARTDLEPKEQGVPRTIRQTYDLLKQLPSSSYYGGTRVADMLFDSRSSRMYTQFVSGDKLIECRLCRKFYD